MAKPSNANIWTRSEPRSAPSAMDSETVYLGGGNAARAGRADLDSLLSTIPWRPWRSDL